MSDIIKISIIFIPVQILEGHANTKQHIPKIDILEIFP